MTRHWLRRAAAAIAFVLVALLPRPAAAQTSPLTLRLSGTGSGRVSVVGTGGGLCDLYSGYHFTSTGLGPGAYLLGVYARSTVTGSFSIVRTVHFSVNATALMSVDVPAAEATVTASTFAVSGWAIDRSVESTTIAGTGVDTLHVYAYPNPGSGQAPIFLGVATVGVARSDVAAAYGARYATSGYTLNIDRGALGLTPGVYNLVVHAHSAVTNAFNNVALVRVTLQ